MNLKLNDLVVIPRCWLAPFYASAMQHATYERNILGLLDSFETIVSTSRFILPGWGANGLENTLRTSGRFTVVKITAKVQIKLMQKIAEHYGAFKITNMQELAISIQKDFLKENSELFGTSERNRQQKYTGGPLDRGWDYLRSNVSETEVKVLPGYDIAFLQMKRIRRIVAQESIFLDDDGADKYIVRSSDLKKLKDVQRKCPKGFQKVYWTPWIQSVLGRLELKNIESIKHKDVLKGVEW